MNFPSPPEVKIRGRWHKIRSAIWDNQGGLVRICTIPLDQSRPFGPFYDLEGEDLRGLVFRQPGEITMLMTITVSFSVPEDWKDEQVREAEEALDGLWLGESIERLVHDNVETRTALDGLRVHVRTDLE